MKALQEVCEGMRQPAFALDHARHGTAEVKGSLRWVGRTAKQALRQEMPQDFIVALRCIIASPYAETRVTTGSSLVRYSPVNRAHMW